MQPILFDDHAWDNLLPLTFTRPVSDLRVGILTLAGKWEIHLGVKPSSLTRSFLAGKYPLANGSDNLLINSALLPDPSLLKALLKLKKGAMLKKGDRLLGMRTGAVDPETFDPASLLEGADEYREPVELVDYPWKIFRLNGREIEADFERLTHDRRSEPLDPTVQVSDPSRVFVEPGFQGRNFTVNCDAGPVYLGMGAEVMEGCLIRGPFALCEGAVLKMGAKVYGPTTLGPHCKAGGEINNSVMHSHSNKAHDGFLGNAVIGQWCNLGADTNNSNLKNNYTEVKIWNYPANRFIKTGLQFCGLVMADHSKCAINTMFNTGTVVGVSANIFGPGFPRNFVPSFSWGGAGGMETYRLEKALETATRVLERRGMQLSVHDREIMAHIYESTEKYRK